MFAHLTTLRSTLSAADQAEFDSKVGALDAAGQGTFADFIAKLKAFLAMVGGLGATINWGCIFGLWPQILAAIAATTTNPVVWLSVFTAYLACAHPVSVP